MKLITFAEEVLLEVISSEQISKSGIDSLIAGAQHKAEEKNLDSVVTKIEHNTEINK